MKKTFSIIIIGFISGIGGSWFYENHVSSTLNESHADQIPIVNNEITIGDPVPIPVEYAEKGGPISKRFPFRSDGHRPYFGDGAES